MLKPTLAGGLTLAIVAGLLLTLAALPASAGHPATPPWEPDPNSLGNVVFYDSVGNVLTGGSDLSHIADYAAATSGPSANANKATLFFANPDKDLPTGSWGTAAASASATFPNTAAPAPVDGDGTPAFTKPLVTLGPTEGNLSAWLGGIAPDPFPGFSNVYQVRIKDSGPFGAGSGSSYWQTSVIVNAGAGTWTVFYPDLAATTTSITTTPPNGGNTTTGNNVTMTATVTPASAANGTVQFFDGATPVGSPQAVTTAANTTGVVTHTSPPDGVHVYTAKFTPDGGALVDDSTSPSSTVTVGPPATPTTTSLSANPLAAPQYDPVTLTANVAPLAALPGSVQFFDGAASLGTDTTDGPPGEYSLVVSTLSQGPHSITATFTPASSSYSPSTSSPVSVTITAPACPGAPDPNGGSCTDDQTIQVTVNAGSLTISTPYTPANPFVLPAMQLNAAGTLLSTSAQFPNAADPQIVVVSSLAGNPNWTVSVSGTDLTSGANIIDGQGLGLTGGTLNASPVFPGTVSFTANPAHDPNTGTPGDGFVGIKGGPFTFAQSSGGGNGSASMYGTLTLLAPTSTQPGTYTGTITFSVA